MKFISFSVTNYRSIREMNEFPINNETILIGKNNEGKSNILKALDIAMGEIINIGRHYNSRIRIVTSLEYNWNEDFPIDLQEKKSYQETSFRLVFRLSDIEVNEFYKEFGSRINGELEIELKFDKESYVKTKIIKKGNQKILQEKIGSIFKFISDRIGFVYIPTIRTENDFIKTISQLMDNAIRGLNKENSEYNEAINRMVSIQENAFDSLSIEIEEQLSEFIPKIEKVDFDIRAYLPRITRREIDVIINDGTATSIRNKGDGVKSLAAIAMLKSNISSEIPTIIALEEPESHLHPEAINQLRETIHSLASKNQVIISTHNPLFVSRDCISSNIIVDSGTARPAKKIKEVREILGVRISDNLINAENILVVEGEDDKIALMKILPSLSSIIGGALKNNTFCIEHLGGAGNLAYKLAEISNHMTKYHVLLDYDKAGQKAYEKAKSCNLIDSGEITYIKLQGLDESEFEDCLNTSIYEDAINDRYRININCIKPEYKKKKWSDRLHNAFDNHTKDWNDDIEKELKIVVANLIPENADEALHKNKRSPIDALITAIEKMLVEC